MIRKALLSTALATLIGVSSESFALAQTTGPGAGKGQGGGSKAAMFEKCDMNPDGRLTKDEFKSCYSARAEKKFTRIDTNNDGSISREEAQEWAQRKDSRGGAGGSTSPEAGQRGGPGGGSSQ